jgi:hypothetical protein
MGAQEAQVVDMFEEFDQKCPLTADVGVIVALVVGNF